MNKLLQMQFSDFKQRFAHRKFMGKQTIEKKKSIKISSDCRNKVQFKNFSVSHFT